jgi:hypothetical protein
MISFSEKDYCYFPGARTTPHATASAEITMNRAGLPFCVVGIDAGVVVVLGWIGS